MTDMSKATVHAVLRAWGVEIENIIRAMTIYQLLHCNKRRPSQSILLTEVIETHGKKRFVRE